MQTKQSFLLLAHKSSVENLIVFSPPTPMLSQNFTPAVSARNLATTFDNNKKINSIIHQLVIAAFIAFATFVAFAGTRTAVTKTIATALVSSRLDYYNSLYYSIALKDILKLQRQRQRIQHYLARVALGLLVSLTQ